MRSIRATACPGRRIVRSRPKRRNKTFRMTFAMTTRRWGSIAPGIRVRARKVVRMNMILTGMLTSAAPAVRQRAASKTFILITMCLGVFLAQLDSTVVYLGIKHIGGELHASISQLQWVLDAYNLAYATFLLTGGTLGDLYGRTRIFLYGIGLILLGSLICALAPNGVI